MFGAVTQAYAVQSEIRPSDYAAEIHAECWFNAQPARLSNPPRLILLEFWSVRSRESRKFVDTMSKLHRAFGDGRLLIIALTDDECKEVRGFIRHEKIEYKVGAESRSAKQYGIDELPGVVLIDPKDQKIVGQWSGREATGKAIAPAIQKLIGPPVGSVGPSGGLPQAEVPVFYAQIADTGDQLASITSEILAGDGEIGPEALSALDRFYEDNLPEDPAQDDAVKRAQDYARGAIMGPDVGYAKLLAGGRLSDAAKEAVRDRVLEIAAKDISKSVRIIAIRALRLALGQPGDPVLLDALRSMREKETGPFVRASISHALDELDPARAAGKEAKAPGESALTLRRKLNRSPDPASSPWADAHAYKQTVPERTTEQLLEDYEAFPDPPDDEIGRQNARLKRDAVQDEIRRRSQRGEIRNRRLVKDHLARALSEEPDWFIRKYVARDLKDIAKRGSRRLRAEIVELFEKRLSVETDHYVIANLEWGLEELQAP